MMTNTLLLPSRYKLIGLFIFMPFLIGWMLWDFNIYDFSFLETGRGGLFSEENMTWIDEILFTGMAIGLLMIAFAREKTEDEYTMMLRLQSLQWAVLANAILLLAANWLLYSEYFLRTMIYNMLSVLIIFVVLFHLVLNRQKSPGNGSLSLRPLYKKIGLFIVILCSVCWILKLWDIYDFPFLDSGYTFNLPFMRQDDPLRGNYNENYIEEILLTGMIIGLLMMEFAREKIEDEFIVSIRLQSLQWGLLLNYVILLIANWLFFGTNFMHVMIYNLFSVLIISILWFNISIVKKNISLAVE